MFIRSLRYGSVLLFAVAGAWAQGSFTNFETPQVHPVDISPDRSTLAVCNTADARVELFDVSTGNLSPLGAVPVGYDPVTVRFRSNAELWVVNQISDSVSIIDVPTRRVRATLDTADEPCDVVFAGNPVLAFVSCSQANLVQRFDPANLATAPTNIEILAEDPRALAVSPDGLTVYAAIFESGNGSTLIAGGNDGTLGGFPTNEAMDDVTNPYGGVNPPPNDPDDLNHDSNLWMPPKNPANGTPPKVGLIVKKDNDGAWRDDNGEDWTPWISGDKAAKSGRYPGWQLIDRDVAVINTATLGVTYINHLMNICMAIGVNPVSGAITVVGTDATNEIRFEPNVSGRFLRVEAAIIPAAGSDPVIADLNAEHIGAASGGEPYRNNRIPPSERGKSIGDPRGIVWNAAGTLGFVTGMGSNNLIAINASGERIALGQSTNLREGPTGMALDDARKRLYVLNRFHGSVSVVNTTTFQEIANVPFFDPTPNAIKVGRKHLYDTHKNSGLGLIACGSCHVDARMDRLAWDLGDPTGNVKLLNPQNNPNEHNLGANLPGLNEQDANPAFEDFHPMKGPMTTQTLQDIIGKEPHHWRGDRDGLEEFNPAFVGLQSADDADPGQGVAGLTPPEMQQFEDFLATIHFSPNPYRNFDNSLPTDLPLPRQFANGRFSLANGAPLPNGNAVNGLQLYRRRDLFDNANPPLDAGNFGCVMCHTLPTGAGADQIFNLNTQSYAPFPLGPRGEHHLALVSQDGATNRAIKIPQLRNQYDKVGFELTPGNPSYAGFGLFHDGSVDSIARFVSEPVFEVQSDQQVADLTALILSFSGSDFGTSGIDTFFIPEPPGVSSKDAHAAVGKQATLVSPSKDLARVNQMLDLANSAKIDVIAKSRQFGYTRGWVYLGNNQFRSDWSSETTLSKTQLLALAAPGAELTFTAVPLGAGIRMGIDRDEDSTLDFDEFLLNDHTPPTITLSSDAPNVVNGPITVTVALSEPTSSFAQDDITPTNATVSAFTGAALAYSFTLTPIATGSFSAKVTGGRFDDLAGNGNAPSNTLSRSNGEQQGSLKVRKPNGGESLGKGSDYKIKWISTGAVGSSVRIELWRNGAFLRVIKGQTDNDGAQKWVVPNDLQVGTGYKVRVVSKAESSINDMSNNTFSVVSGP